MGWPQGLYSHVDNLHRHQYALFLGLDINNGY